MHRFLLSGTSIFLVLFIALTPPVISSAAEKKAVVNDNSGCAAVLLKDREYFPALIAAIDGAKSEIIMSFFLFKAGVHKNSYPDRVLSHLVLAAQRGVNVKVLLENSGGRDQNIDAENRKTKQLLNAKGVEVYLDSVHVTMHTKLVVIDQRLVLLGSHNLTQSALKYNNETSIMINRPELAREAHAYLMKIIKESK